MTWLEAGEGVDFSDELWLDSRRIPMAPQQGQTHREAGAQSLGASLGGGRAAERRGEDASPIKAAYPDLRRPLPGDKRLSHRGQELVVYLRRARQRREFRQRRRR
jgi:hypothetical protein